MTITDPNEFLAGGTKIPSARFTNPGDTVVGTITALEVGQVRSFETGDPETWPDGNPKLQLVITVQTDERDSTIEDDDGQRRLFAKKPSEMLRAIAAVSTAVGKPLEVGGRLAVKHTGTKPHENSRLSPIKLYEAAYKPPAGAANDLLADDSVVASSVDDLV